MNFAGKGCVFAIHRLRPADGARHRRKRVGRGRASGHGKTSCRGQKGEMSRKGSVRAPGFEGGQMPLIRRIPKRGFRRAMKRVYTLVNVGRLSVFPDGSEVTPVALEAAGLAKSVRDGVKILGGGELARKLVVVAHAFSAGARAKIEAAGGQCRLAGKG